MPKSAQCDSATSMLGSFLSSVLDSEKGVINLKLGNAFTSYNRNGRGTSSYPSFELKNGTFDARSVKVPYGRHFFLYRQHKLCASGGFV